MIIIDNLRRPGLIYDSSKLAILLNKITGDISNRTKNNFIAKGKISGQTLQITVLQLNLNTGKYARIIRNEQELLAGRISNFLNTQGISHDIKVK